MYKTQSSSTSQIRFELLSGIPESFPVDLTVEEIISLKPEDYPYSTDIWLSCFGMKRDGISADGGYRTLPGTFVGYAKAVAHSEGYAVPLWDDGNDTTYTLTKSSTRNCIVTVCKSGNALILDEAGSVKIPSAMWE